MLKDNLAMLRNMRGFSQEETAERIGISRQAYAKWENGSTVPDIEKCSLLAEMYGVTLDSLIRDQMPEAGRPEPAGPAGKMIWGTVTMNGRGQIVIPKAARAHFGLQEGQRFVLLSDDNEGFALIPVEMFEKRLSELGRLSGLRID